jgi:hypothetical protein
MKLGKFLPLLSIACLLAACGPQTKYYWGDYSSSLFDYYADHTTEAQYDQALLEVTNDAGTQAKQVPPGIFAEYGYEELAHGNVDHAIALFQREKELWPESAVFMDKAIAAAKAGKKSPSEPIGGDSAPAAAAPTS